MAAPKSSSTLPKDAREALIERAIDLAERPWDQAVVRPSGDDSRFCETVFGSGYGVFGLYVDEDTQLIRIFDIIDIMWIG